jgi:hypothetical protein
MASKAGRSSPKVRADVLLRGEQSGGQVSLIEVVVPSHSAGPPLHTHDFDEAFYMREGDHRSLRGGDLKPC